MSKDHTLFGRNIKDKPWKLTDRCVEDAWFNYHNDCGNLLSATDVGPSQRKDVDKLCKQAWADITSKTSSRVHHQCDKKGYFPPLPS